MPESIKRSVKNTEVLNVYEKRNEQVESVVFTFGASYDDGDASYEAPEAVDEAIDDVDEIDLDKVLAEDFGVEEEVVEEKEEEVKEEKEEKKSKKKK